MHLKRVIAFGMVVAASSFSGCVFAPPTYGARGVVLPGNPQYDRYLANCRSMSPRLESHCQQYGEPAVIKVGSSGGYFVWKEPRTLLSVRSFGNTSVSDRIPRDLLQYVAEPGEIAAARPAVDRRQPAPVQPAVASAAAHSGYSVEVFERVSGDDFAYRFRIVLKDGANTGIGDLQRIKRELRNAVAEDYRAAMKGGGSESVQVDFPEYAVKDGRIEGRAEVMRIGIVALDYDAASQKGRISVRIGSNRFDEARKWVRSNIETIVRDKNIALVTGKVPQDKRFFLGSEKVLPGNILEIAFETE